MQVFDFLVIGGGSGGLACAKRAAAHGASVALVEAGRLGGTCVNVGCVPKKVMWNAASIAESIKYAKDYGFSLGDMAFQWTDLKRSRDAYIERLNGIYKRGLDKSGVTEIAGYARFVDSHTVEVRGQLLRGDRILLATGGRPLVPAIAGAEMGITSDGFFELEKQPKHVAIVGAGYIATELAGVFKALGSEVTLLMRGKLPLRGFDSLLRETLMEEMRKDGMNLLTCTELERVERDEEGLLTLFAGEQKLEGLDCLLWATGRVPNSDKIGLEHTDVQTDERGFVVVDSFENTSAPHIHAIGDVTGRVQLTPVAIAAGRKLADRLFGGKPEAHLSYENVPTVVFTHPPIGTVGLTEEEALQQFGADEVQVYTSRFTNMFYSIVEHRVQTAMKVIAVGEKRKVVGIHAIGLGVDEMIQGFAVALQMGATLADLNRTIAIHPTASEELVLIG